MKKKLIFIVVILGLFSVWMITKNNALISSNNETKGIKIGEKAPELNLKTPEGKEISLTSLRGKMVLIDFWASWCAPCRKGNSDLIKIYKKVKDKNFMDGKGFTIYSVSLDTKLSMWKRAIKQDDLVWQNQVSDLKGWHSIAVQLYQISAIPNNFLLNGKGIIIAKGLNQMELENKLAQQIK